MRAAGPGRFLKRAGFRTAEIGRHRVISRGVPVERCLACEADGEQGTTALRVLFDFYAL